MNDLKATIDFIQKYNLSALPSYENAKNIKIYQNESATKQAVVVTNENGIEIGGKIIKN